MLAILTAVWCHFLPFLQVKSSFITILALVLASPSTEEIVFDLPGLALMLPHCSHVDLLEYVPSVRLTKRCHYWDVAEDSSCTFGVWHPLAAEKLLALALNVASDQSVFSDGYVRVPGYDTLQC
jgi:hypothetical protein